MDELNKTACERTKAETMKTPGVPDPLLSSPGFFPERVRLTPDLPAVIYETNSGTETVTWRDLLKKAARMQSLLKKLPGKTALLPARGNASYAAAFLGALYLKKTGFVPDQIQDFYPTPGSLSANSRNTISRRP